MPTRLQQEQGQGMIEMILAITVITIAVLALMASYDEAFFSLHSSARKTAAASLAESQLELYSALYSSQSAFSSIGLSSTEVTTAKASDTYYSTDESSLTPSNTTEVSNASCTSTSTLPQCMPVQTNVVGTDGKKYRIETFVRDVSQSLTCTTTPPCPTTTERDVTVIVRDPNVSGSPKVYTVTAAFDQGPRS
jgi:Tfp pilus assembly protein PilV